jgi:hypothetical protein
MPMYGYALKTFVLMLAVALTIKPALMQVLLVLFKP